MGVIVVFALIGLSKELALKLIAIALLLIISALLHSCHSEQIASKKEQDPACKQLPKPGRCKGRIESYFFNLKTGSCMPFDWGGCGGSRPFQTHKECQEKCL